MVVTILFISSFAKANQPSEIKCSQLTSKATSKACWDGIRPGSWDLADNFSEWNVTPVLSVKNLIARRHKNGSKMWKTAWKFLINLLLNDSCHIYVEINIHSLTSLFTMNWICTWSCRITSGTVQRWMSIQTFQNGQRQKLRVSMLFLNWTQEWMRNLRKEWFNETNEEFIIANHSSPIKYEIISTIFIILINSIIIQ